MGGVRVDNRRRLIRIEPSVLVFAPYVLLALICGGITALFLMSDETTRIPRPYLIAGGLVIYLGVAAMLGRLGQMQIAQLESLGMTDSLSLLPNRRALHADAERSRSEGEEYAIALIDLDGFKLVNDNYGHFVGDKVIKEAALILQEVCGSDARCYRLGGDEFAISVFGPISNNILEGICRTLIERLEKPIWIEDRAIVIGASVGLSRSDGSDGLTSSELLRRSDVAMYASKQGGKMRCTWFRTEFDQTREAMQELDSELRTALAEEQFTLNYQPLVDAQTAKIVAVEALIRWERPDGKKLGPNIFIPIAESSGLINPIGLWVLRRACIDAKEWHGVKLSVNMSAAQLCNPEFPIQMGHILEETGFPADRLELEITETCLVFDPILAERSLKVIRGFGVNVVLDDFGTGYASIGFLRQFRFEKLKLDRSLIVDAEADEGSRAMMLSSISVARAMKMDVTAEGVETEAQAALARISGCDQIQGWLYFKPMPADEFEKQLRLEQTEAPDKKDTGKRVA